MASTLERKPLLSISTSVFALGGLVWFGTTLARMIVGFDMFNPGTTVLKTAQAEAVQLHTVWLFTMLGGWSGWAYVVTSLGGLAALLLSMRSWKDKGWILMSGLLFATTLPGQVWIILQDIQLWTLFDSGTGLPLASAEDVMGVFLHRMTDVTSSVVNGLTILMAFTIALVLAWQPLRRPEPLTNPMETETE
jgi:hypothetical protein